MALAPGGAGGGWERWHGHLAVGGEAFGAGSGSQGALGQLICPKRASPLSSRLFSLPKFIILRSERARQLVAPML